MKIIILAAGKGERLYPLTKNTPKPLIDLGNGETLLERQLHYLSNSKVISEVIIVIGYLHNQIESKLKTFNTPLAIKTVYNPFYEMSNNLITLWLSKYEMNEDFLIINGDNIVASDVIKNLIEQTNDGIYVTICYKDNYREEDMKVTLDEGKKILRVSKEIKNGDAESVGLVKVAGERYRTIYRNVLEELARNKHYLNKFWLETFNALANKGVEINSFEIDKDKWSEVDFHFDLKDIKELIKKFKI
ncbi:MAG: NTP transferase domain-containing protein [Candidatus Lokiarchaeota archaeon]|nr:NTP transferase domain-containing protein [Candidatus Lokiarchaeota archaeon]